MRNFCAKGECEKRILIAELRQCWTELEEAANLLRPHLSGMASIYDKAADHVKATINNATLD